MSFLFLIGSFDAFFLVKNNSTKVQYALLNKQLDNVKTDKDKDEDVSSVVQN